MPTNPRAFRGTGGHFPGEMSILGTAERVG